HNPHRRPHRGRRVREFVWERGRRPSPAERSSAHLGTARIAFEQPSPKQRCDRISIQGQVQRLAPHLTLKLPSITLVRDDKDAAAIRILKGHMIDSAQIPVRSNYLRAPLDRLGKMSEGPILSAVCKFMGLGVNRHYSTAGEGADVWRSLFIQD